MKKVAIYSRKSRLSEKGESIQNQIDLCKKYAASLGEVEFITYIDEGFSGGNTNRPQFQKLMSDVKKKRFDYLICYRLDRISRNVADFSSTLRLLEENDINFISITEQFDTTTVMGRAMINISATFAQMERETIAERIKDNMMELSKTGRWLGGTPPLGYKSEQIEYSNGGHAKKMYKLTVIEEEMDKVKLIFSLYAKYKSCSPVSRYLCTNSIKGKNGGDFSRNTVLQIITNPVYCIGDDTAINYFKSKGSSINCTASSTNGLMVYNKRKGGKKDNPVDQWIISSGLHEGVISSKDWINCQNILEETKKKNSPRASTGNKFLLSGLIKCGHCNHSMCSWSRYYKQYDRYSRYYRCELKNRAATRCTCKMLNADYAEAAVISMLKDLNLTDFDEYNINSTKKEQSKIKKELTILNRTLADNQKTLAGLIKKLAIIDDFEILALIQSEIKSLKADISSIEKQINELTLQTYDIEDETEKKQNFIDCLNTFKNSIDLIEDIEIKRNMISSLVEYFTYNSDTKEINFKLRL